MAPSPAQPVAIAIPPSNGDSLAPVATHRDRVCATPWSAAAAVAVGRSTRAATPTGRILPIGAASADRARRIAVVVEPATCGLVPEPELRVPVTIARVEVIAIVHATEFV